MRHIELDDKLINLLREKILKPQDGYIHIQIKDRQIVFITFEEKDLITRPDEVDEH